MFLSRLIRSNPLTFNRTLLTRNRGSLLQGQSYVEQSANCLAADRRFASTKDSVSKKPDNKLVDDIKYEIKVKESPSVKQIFQQAYSLYGPLFVATHIAVSLTSLGFFYGLAYTTFDLTYFLPEAMIDRLTSGKVMEISAEGSKFVVAYAVHKVVLPLRLGITLYLTRRLAKVVKLKRETSTDKKA